MPGPNSPLGRAKRRRRQQQGEGHVGPDGPRVKRSPRLVDTGKGLPGTRQQRERPRPKHITAGQPQRPKRHPVRRNAPRRAPDPFRQEVNALTSLQYGGQQRELAAQGRISDQAAVNQQGWYADYQRQVQQAALQQQAFTQGLQAAQFQQANTAAGTDQQANQQLLQQQQTSAAQRGGTVDPALAAQMQGGVAARQVAGTQFGGLLAAQGQAQGAYLNNRVGVAAQQGIQAQQDEQRKRAQIGELARQLQADKGAFKVKTRFDLQEQQHKSRLEDAAFGLDVTKERNDQRQSVRDDRRTARDQRIDNRRMARSDRERARHNRETESEARAREQRMRAADLADNGKVDGSSGGAGKFTPTQVRSGRKSLRTLVGQVRSDPHGKNIPKNVDPLLARAAVQIADHGGVSPELARKIKRQYGFTPKIRKGSKFKKDFDKGKQGVGELF